MTALDTKPSSVVMSVRETLNFGIDVTAQLAAGQSIASPVVTLIDLSTDSTVALADAATVASNTVSQIVRGPSVLVAGTNYRLQLVYRASPSVDVWETGFIIFAVDT